MLNTHYDKTNYNSEANRPKNVEPINEVIFNKIQIEDYHLTPHRDTIITVKNFVPSAWRELGGDRKDESINSADIIINPANISHETSWNGEISFTVFSLDTVFLSHTAYEYIDPDGVNLLPHFPQSDPLLYWIVETLSVQTQLKESTDQTYIDQLTSTLIMHLLKNYCSTTYQLPESSYVLSNTQKQRVVDYIEANLDKRVGVVELANLLNMSRYHFTRLFKESIGVCPGQYSIERRLKKATWLLKNTKLSIGTISRQTGFCSQSHFISTFGGKMRVSPAQYRMML
jgi:AraC family transcriptional regulator